MVNEIDTTSAHAPQGTANFAQAPGNMPKEQGMDLDRVANHPGASSARQGAMVSQVLQPQFAKLANPGPLGLLSFAITTFVVGLYECGAGFVL
jgi:Predicted membrane protein